MMPLLSTPKGRRNWGCRGGAITTPNFGKHWRKPYRSSDLLWLITLQIFRPSDDPTPVWPRQWQLVKYRAKKTCGREENPTMKIDFVGLFSKYYIHTEIIYMKSLQQDQTDVGVCCSISVFLQKQVAKTISRALARKLLVWLGLVWKFELTSIVDPKQTLVKDLKTRNLNNLYRS